ncbi:MAG: hypothetical protein V3R29_10110 [Candidatus Acidoferrales bacterium]
MASSTQTSPGSMARVRPYRESDLHKLEELFRRNFPDLLLPDLRGESSDLNLVLEDAQGELQMAVVGGLFPAAFPLIDPNARIAEAEREDFSALLAAAEQELREKKIAPCILVLWLPEKQLIRRLLVEGLGFINYRNQTPYAKFVEQSVMATKQ